MMTNGDEILFVKIAQQETRQYALSDSFAPDSPRNNLLKVLSILKHIGQIIVA